MCEFKKYVEKPAQVEAREAQRGEVIELHYGMKRSVASGTMVIKDPRLKGTQLLTMTKAEFELHYGPLEEEPQKKRRGRKPKEAKDTTEQTPIVNES